MKRIAIVGSGCSGIGALWALDNAGHDVHLYEASDRLGGHTNTASFFHKDLITKVDTGFIVLNSATYPNFITFLKHLGVPTVPTDMTFGVSRDQGSFEWSGTSLSAVFSQRKNLFSLRMWAMLFDIVRFNQFALDVLSREDQSDSAFSPSEGLRSRKGTSSQDESIGLYLQRNGYSDGFRDDYLIPMTSAVWSTDADKCSLDFPVLTLVRFLYNHHLLNTISARPSWMTIPGGTYQYIEAVLKQAPRSRVFLSSKVTSVLNCSDGRVTLKTVNGDEASYDHVVLAVHGDQILPLLGNSASAQERNILGSFHTSQNKAVLHSDLQFMPRSREAWSSWNYLTETSSKSSEKSPARVSLTYNMNILQHIPVEKFGDVLVTLNPLFPPRKDSIQGSWLYSHPLYNSAAIKSQQLLPQIQNIRNISYCGAWTKYGFHEDGFSSGVKVAIDHLGATIPWQFVDSTFSRGPRPRLTWKDHSVRIIVTVIQILVIAVEYLVGFRETKKA